jgi:hypothetical protein
MKLAIIILGILGSLAFGGLGAQWISDYEANRAQIKSLGTLASALGDKGSEVERAINGVERARAAGYVMVMAALAGVAASLSVGRSARVAGAVLLIGAALPALLAPLSLLAGFLLVIAGVLALRLKPTASHPAAARVAA